MRFALALAVLLAVAPAARADRGWPDPTVVNPYPSSGGVAAVASDGTLLAAAAGAGHGYVTVGGRTMVVEGLSGPLAAAGGDRLVLAYSTGAKAWVSQGSASGLEPAVDLGRGVPVAVAGDRLGDLAVLVGHGTSFSLVYAPAGQSFGAPQRVPGLGNDGVGALALGANGQPFIGVAGYSVRVVTETASGTFSAPFQMPGTSSATPAPGALPPYGHLRLAAADNGQAIATWGVADGSLQAAVRNFGTWSPLGGLGADGPGATLSGAVATDPAGDAVVVWNAGPGKSQVHAATVSLTDDRVLASFAFTMAGLPQVVSAPDGSTLVTADDDSAKVYAVRRDGTGGFGPVRVAGCGQHAAAGGFDRGGAATIGYDDAQERWVTATDAEGAPTAGACPSPAAPAPPDPRVSPRPAQPGQTVTLTAVAPDAEAITGIDWDLDGAAGFETHTDGLSVQRAFPAGSRVVYAHEQLRAGDGTVSDALASAYVDTPAQVTVTTGPQRLRDALHHGIRVRIAAAAPASVGASVRLTIIDDSATGAETTRVVTLPAAPRTVRLRLITGRKALRRSRHPAVAVVASPGDRGTPDRYGDVPTLASALVQLRR